VLGRPLILDPDAGVAASLEPAAGAGVVAAELAAAEGGAGISIAGIGGPAGSGRARGVAPGQEQEGLAKLAEVQILVA